MGEKRSKETLVLE